MFGEGGSQARSVPATKLLLKSILQKLRFMVFKSGRHGEAFL
ncbi:hypothetical protein C100_14395 [Sphingobium sp. C100]|nr:hypothetical protein C100_14395 [Sphingobium sp. C100]